jgi:hypothetical protein
MILTAMGRDMEGLARKTFWMENIAQLRLVSNIVSGFADRDR